MPKSIQSIERAAAVLRLLARGPGRLGVVELAGSLGLPKGTVHGILRTLAGVGFVEQDGITGKYQLGATLLHLGTSYLDVNELRSRAINWADALASRSGEAVRIGTLLEGRVLVVHHVFRPDDSLQTVRDRPAAPAARLRARQGAAGVRRRPPRRPPAGPSSRTLGGRSARPPSWPAPSPRPASAAGPTRWRS